MSLKDTIISTATSLISRAMPVAGRVIAMYGKEKPKDYLGNTISCKESDEAKRYSYVRQLYLQHGAVWDEVNIFGIRDERHQQQDLFNDLIGVAYDSCVKLYTATCDPGAYWTQVGGYNPDKKGVAHVCLGFYKDVYQVGMHRDQEALIQSGAPITIWRDRNRNFIQDSAETVERGFYAVDIHTTGHKPPVIGKWSAGCQVVQSTEDFHELMTIVKTSDKFRISGRKAKFSYFLFSMNQMTGFIV